MKKAILIIMLFAGLSACERKPAPPPAEPEWGTDSASIIINDSITWTANGSRNGSLNDTIILMTLDMNRQISNGDIYPFEIFSFKMLRKNMDLQKLDSTGFLGVDVSVVEQTKSAYAWDICRAVSLAKWCYWCGYLTENETWAIMQQASEIAKQHGKNWTDYTVSFLLGRTIQGFDLDDLIVESKQILHSQNPLLSKIEDIDVYNRHSFQ